MAIVAASVIQDLALIMVIASVMALVSFKVKQPMIFGYILAGMILGPYTPPGSLLLDSDVVNVFAQIGIVLLLFVVGLEFPLARLRTMGRKVTLMASAKVLGTFAVGYLVAYALGFSSYDRLFVALAISVTSTVVALKVMEGLGVVSEEAGSLIVAISVVDDILVVSALALLQSVALSGSFSLLQLATSVGLVVLFIGGAVIVGSRTVPRFINFIARTNNEELLLVAMLGIAFGFAIIGSKIGISLATGAFFAGVVVAESSAVNPARVISRPLRDMFSAIFFVSMGALMNVFLIPVFIISALFLILASVVMKFVLTVSAATVQGFQRSLSLKAGVGMSGTGGEMSLVVAKGGADIAATSSFVLPMVGVITLVTTFLTPYVVKTGWKLVTQYWSEPKKAPPQATTP